MDNSEHDNFWITTAQRALHDYALADVTLEWASYSHNAVFRVNSASGEYVLRLTKTGNPDALAAEAAWLRFVHTKTSLDVPNPVETCAGQMLTFVDHGIYGVLFHRMAGLACNQDNIIPDDVHLIGAFLGKLHCITSQYSQTIQQWRSSRPRLDWEGLFGEQSVYHPGEGSTIFTARQREILDAAAESVRAVMDTLGPDQMGMIHGDLLCKNILFHDGRVRALDFEYCGWGYYLYDLAPLLWQLRHHAHYPTFEDALWAGYTSTRPVEPQQRRLLEAFIAGRQVASCRWIAQNVNHPVVGDKAQDILAARTNELQAYLQTGRLERHSVIL